MDPLTIVHHIISGCEVDQKSRRKWVNKHKECQTLTMRLSKWSQGQSYMYLPLCTVDICKVLIKSDYRLWENGHKFWKCSKIDPYDTCVHVGQGQLLPFPIKQWSCILNVG